MRQYHNLLSLRNKNNLILTEQTTNYITESLDFHCQYLWEFLQHLLADSKYHSCIVWKNERRGIFRLTDHQRVADLWGKHKKRENMTYDKLSRALRYYYSRNILKKVDGQRLTYKFCRNLDGKKFASWTRLIFSNYYINTENHMYMKYRYM